MNNTALLVIDVQQAMVDDNPFAIDTVLKNINKLLARCRANGIEVIFVRHDGGRGDELEQGTPGWQICREIAPKEGERIFDKRYNCAFRQTGLKEYLDGRGITSLILTGMQTEYCIDATVKVAFEYGYALTIPENTVTTYDNPLLSAEQTNDFYYNGIWKDRFAAVCPTDAAAG